MASLNRILRLFTHEKAPSPRISPLAQLERSVMSCLLWEDEFYESGLTIGQRIAELVAQVPAWRSRPRRRCGCAMHRS